MELYFPKKYNLSNIKYFAGLVSRQGPVGEAEDQLCRGDFRERGGDWGAESGGELVQGERGYEYRRRRGIPDRQKRCHCTEEEEVFIGFFKWYPARRPTPSASGISEHFWLNNYLRHITGMGVRLGPSFRYWELPMVPGQLCLICSCPSNSIVKNPTDFTQGQ